MSYLRNIRDNRVVFFVRHAETGANIDIPNNPLNPPTLVHHSVPDGHRTKINGDTGLTAFGQMQAIACRDWVDDVLTKSGRVNKLTYVSEKKRARQTAAFLKGDTLVVDSHFNEIASNESNDNVEQRLKCVVEYLENDSAPDTIVIVTHSKFINLIMQKMLYKTQITNKRAPIQIDNTSVTIMVFDRYVDRWSCLLIGGTEHLSSITTPCV